jgi:glycerol uptake facilitator-like aquaporin
VDRTYWGVPIAQQALLLPDVGVDSLSNVYVIETICTFIFVMINLLVKTRKTMPTNDGFLGCLAVAFTFLAMLTISKGKTGACINPAVGLAQTCYQII